ncbi:cytochrome bd oxidase small subunit CydS [Virgibacillus sp. W0430]
MNEFIMFFAPFIVLILAILFVFWVAPKDKSVAERDKTE